MGKKKALVTVPRGTDLEDFWKLLPGGAEDRLDDLEADGRTGVTKAELDGVGRVEKWLDACSEGSDRGGYVSWYELLDVRDDGGRPVRLEQDTGDGEILFADRMTRLL